DLEGVRWLARHIAEQAGIPLDDRLGQEDDWAEGLRAAARRRGDVDAFHTAEPIEPPSTVDLDGQHITVPGGRPVLQIGPGRISWHEGIPLTLDAQGLKVRGRKEAWSSIQRFDLVFRKENRKRGTLTAAVIRASMADGSRWELLHRHVAASPDYPRRDRDRLKLAWPGHLTGTLATLRRAHREAIDQMGGSEDVPDALAALRAAEEPH
ncbi:MAG: hypothetical protein KC656_34555, partial [Myxococcales bacterium]|nr:hypothetical protein [Myxococcales bacterium]